MKKHSLVSIVSLVAAGLLVVVAIFKITSLVRNSSQDLSQPEVIVEEEIIGTLPQESDSTTDMSQPMDMRSNTPQMADQDRESVITISSPDQIDALAQNGKPAVLKFYAPWCGACQYVNGFYDELPAALGGAVTFYSIDVGNKKVMDRIEELQLLAQPIEYLPTFVYRMNGTVINQATGAKEKAELVDAARTAFGL